jgi:hypothetical protein
LKAVQQDNGHPRGFRRSDGGLGDPVFVFGQFRVSEKDSSHCLPDLTIPYLFDQ